MKKVVKWTTYIIILCALVAITICYSVIPNETKQVIDIIIGYINTPVAIAGISTTIGGILIFLITRYILNNSKFGRKEIEIMKSDINSAKDIISAYKMDISNKITDYKVLFDELKDNCENKVTIMYEEFNDLQNTLLTSLKTIPNKKVQEIVTQYEIKFTERKEEIVEKTINSNKYIDKKIDEIKNQFNKMYKELEGRVEVILNETEETKDN